MGIGGQSSGYRPLTVPDVLSYNTQYTLLLTPPIQLTKIRPLQPLFARRLLGVKQCNVRMFLESLMLQQL